MTFEEYLESKKIDSTAFKMRENERWHLFQQEFDQMHPKSFTSQKLFLINAIRRSYPLNTSKNVAGQVQKTENKSIARPKTVAKRPIQKSTTSSKPKIPKPVIKKPKND